MPVAYSFTMGVLVAVGMVLVYLGAWVQRGLWRRWAETRTAGVFPHCGVGLGYVGAGLLVIASGMAMRDLFDPPTEVRVAWGFYLVGGAVALFGLAGGLTRMPRRLVPRWLREHYARHGYGPRT